jgi:hypothetical protein
MEVDQGNGQAPATLHDQECQAEVAYLRERHATAGRLLQRLDPNDSPPVDQDQLDLDLGREELAKLVDTVRARGQDLDLDQIGDRELVRLGRSARQRRLEEALEEIARDRARPAPPPPLTLVEAMRIGLVRRYCLIIVDGHLDPKSGKWQAPDPRYNGLTLDQKKGMGQPILQLDPEPHRRHTTDIALVPGHPLAQEGDPNPALAEERIGQTAPDDVPLNAPEIAGLGETRQHRRGATWHSATSGTDKQAGQSSRNGQGVRDLDDDDWRPI